MKKFLASNRIMVLAVLLMTLFFTSSGTVVYGSDASAMYSKTMKISSGEKKVSYIIIDLNRPEIQIDAVTAKNRVGATDTLESIAALAGGSGKEVIAAINGTYFSAYDNNPLPWGTIQTDGEITHIGNTGSTIGFTESNQVKLDNLYTSIEGYINDVHRWYAWNINHTYTNEDAIAIMTPEFGTQTHEHSFTSIVIDAGKVTGIKTGPVSIPADGYVIVTGLQEIISRFKIGDEVSYKTLFNRIDFNTNPPGKGDEIEWDIISTAVGAGPTLIKGGKVMANGASEGFFEEKINTNRGQRSFIGVTLENKLIIGTVPSVSIPELAEIAQKLELHNAMNLDGGASSGLYYKGKVLHKPGRLLSNAIVITSKKQKSMPASDIKVNLNGIELGFDQSPVVINNRTLVPLRAIFEALGAEIKWDGVTKTVTGIKGETIVSLTVGNHAAKLNGKDLPLDVPAVIVNERTLVPARFIAEALGAKVEWESNSRTVIIQH